MSPPIDGKTIGTLASGARWSALVKLDEPLHAIQHWDTSLIRHPRVLVPMDVQALYVPKGGAERFVRLPFAMTTVDGQPPEAMPGPFDKGAPRPAGVHLHWAMPDSLLSGTMRDASGDSNKLSLAALPDRWAVLRIAVPRGALKALVKGWVIEAATTRVTPLEDWPEPASARAATGQTIEGASLTGAVGGSLLWSAGYDAVLNRFGFHDTLSDLPQAAPGGVIGDFASYLVCGWWSDPRLDPLDRASSPRGLQSRLNTLKWRLTDDLEDRGGHFTKSDEKLARQAGTPLRSQQRYKEFSASGLSDATRKSSAAIETGRGIFTETASHFAAAPVHEPYASLLHGVINGVPVDGGVVADQKPSAEGMSVAFGFDNDDLAAVFASDGLKLSAQTQRRGPERLLAAFTHDLLAEVGTANGIFAVEEREHFAAFSSRPGEPGPEERVIDSKSFAKAGGTRRGRTSVQGKHPEKQVAALGAQLFWSASRRGLVQTVESDKLALAREQRDSAKFAPAEPAARIIRRPTPRYFEPMEPMIAVRGPKRSLRHGYDRKRSPDGRLQCRWPSQIQPGMDGLVKGSDLAGPVPTGGLPPEVLPLVHSALLCDPYIAPWRAEAVSALTKLDKTAVEQRVFAETALRYTKDGSYSAGEITGGRQSAYAKAALASALNRFSLIGGVDPDPVSVTSWAQPWVPLWLEWRVEIDVSDRLDGWRLDTVDFELDGASPPDGAKREITGRSPLHGGVAVTLESAVHTWLRAEQERDDALQSQIDDATEKQLADIAQAIGGIDILAASLDSLHDVLLGLPVGPYGVLSPAGAGGVAKPEPVAVPQLLMAGRLSVKEARIVDAFGRTLDLPAQNTLYPARNALANGGTELPPRLLRPARWMFRLVDPADLTAQSREASIDQAEPALMVNPVAGFLLPDHIDEALEIFDAKGQPLGQLLHEPISGSVAWEIAPGREGPPDAGPAFKLEPAQQILGSLAAGLVAKDAQTRAGQDAKAGEESALSAILRAIDTTLWTVDTFSTLGSAHIAGLVGRPIAVARAVLRLDISTDLGELNLGDPAKLAARQAAYAALNDRAFPVRIGELTRDDDGVLGFFVDDDYSRFHVVDKVVRDSCLDAGRWRGQLGLLGAAPHVPAVAALTHPYIFAEDELKVRPGQAIRLTLLLHPGGKCHLTSGILPRKSLQLSRDWIHDGLSRIAPSARVGPVLIDQDKVRLPLIASFGAEQLWTRRDSSFTWKDDPILAATQTALLPSDPATVEEGYIRIAPVKPAGPQEG